MNNYEITQLKIKRKSFIYASILVDAMNKYRFYMRDEDKNTIDVYATYSYGLPLPSGRWGNAIALALEVNNYYAAEYLIDNAERLELDTTTVVSELGFKNPWSLKEEFLYSTLTYENNIRPKTDYETKESYDNYVRSLLRNNISYLGIEKRLNITEEDKKVLK